MRAPAAGEDCADGSFRLLAAEGGYVAEGEARLPRRGGEPADAVVLTYGANAGEQTAFALAEVGAAGVRDDASWRKSFSPSALPAVSQGQVTAWAFDAEEGKAYGLCEAHAAGLPR